MPKKHKKKLAILLGSGITTAAVATSAIVAGALHLNYEYNPYLVSFGNTEEGNLTINIKIPNSKPGDKLWVKFIDKEKGPIWVEGTIDSEGRLVINTGDLPIPSESNLDSIWKEKPISSEDKPFIEGGKLRDEAKETIKRPDVKIDVVKDSQGNEIKDKKVVEFNKQLAGKEALFTFENLDGEKLPPIKGYINEDGKAIIDTSSLPLNDFYTLTSITDAEKPDQKLVNLSQLERPITIDKLTYDSVRTHNDNGQVEIISGLSKENANKKVVAVFETKDGKKTTLEGTTDKEGQVIFNTSALEEGEWYLQEIKDATSEEVLKTRDQMDVKAEKAPIFMPSVLRLDDNKKEIFELKVDGHLIGEELTATFVGPAPESKEYTVKAKVDSLGKVAFDTSSMPKGYEYTLESVKDKSGKKAIDTNELTDEEKIADKRHLIPYYPTPKSDGDTPIWVPATPDPNDPSKLIPDQEKLDEIKDQNPGKEFEAKQDEIIDHTGEKLNPPMTIVDGKDKVDNSYIANFVGENGQTYPVKTTVNEFGEVTFNKEDLANLPAGQNYELKEDGITNKEGQIVPGLKVKDEQKKVTKELKATYTDETGKTFDVKSKLVSENGQDKIVFETSDQILPTGHLYTLNENSITYPEGIKEEEKNLLNKENTIDKRYTIPYYPNPKKDGDTPIEIPATIDENGNLIPDQAALDKATSDEANKGKEFIADKDAVKDYNGEEVKPSKDIIDGKDKIDNSYKAIFKGENDSQTYTITLRLDSSNTPVLDAEELKKLPIGQKYNFENIKDKNDQNVTDVKLEDKFSPVFDKTVTITYNYNDAEGKAKDPKEIVSSLKDGKVFFDTANDVPLSKGFLYTLDSTKTSFANEEYVTQEQKDSVVTKETVDKRYEIPYYPNPKSDGDEPIWVPAIPNEEGKLVPDQGKLDEIKDQNPGKEFIADKSEIKESDGDNKQIVQDKEIVDGKDVVDNSYTATFKGKNDGKSYSVIVRKNTAGEGIFDKPGLEALPVGQEYDLESIQNKEQADAKNDVTLDAKFNPVFDKRVTVSYKSKNGDNVEQEVKSITSTLENYKVVFDTASDNPLAKGYLYTLDESATKYANEEYVTQEQKDSIKPELTVDKRYQIPYYPNPKSDTDQPIWVPATPDENGKLVPDETVVDKIKDENPGKEFQADKSEIKDHENNKVMDKEIADGKDVISDSYTATFKGKNDGKSYNVIVRKNTAGEGIFDKLGLEALPVGQEYDLESVLNKDKADVKSDVKLDGKFDPVFNKKVTVSYKSKNGDNVDQEVKTIISSVKDGKAIFDTKSDNPLAKGYLYTLDESATKYANEEYVTNDQKTNQIEFQNEVDKRYKIPYYPNPKTDTDQPIWVPATPGGNGNLVPDQSELDKIKDENPGKEFEADKDGITDHEGNKVTDKDIIDGKDRIDASYSATFVGDDKVNYNITLRKDSSGKFILDEEELREIPLGQKYHLTTIKDKEQKDITNTVQLDAKFSPIFDKTVTVSYNYNDATGAAQPAKAVVSKLEKGTIAFDTASDNPLAKGYLYTLASKTYTYANEEYVTDIQKQSVQPKETVDKRYQIPYYPNPKSDSDQPIWVPATPDGTGKLVPDQTKLDEIANNPENAGKELVANKDEIKANDGNGTESPSDIKDIVDGKEKIDNSYTVNYVGDDQKPYTITLRLDSAKKAVLDEAQLKALPLGQKYAYKGIIDKNNKAITDVTLEAKFNPIFDKTISITYTFDNGNGVAQTPKTLTSSLKDGKVFFDIDSDNPLAKGYLYKLDSSKTSFANADYADDKQKEQAEKEIKNEVDKRYKIPYYPNPKTDTDKPIWIPATPDENGKLVPDQTELDKAKDENPGKELVADKDGIVDYQDKPVNDKQIADGKDKIDDSYVATFIGNDGKEYKVKVILDSKGNPVFDKTDIAKLPAGQDYKLKEPNGITKQDGSSPNPAVNVSEAQKTIKKGITGIYTSNVNKEQKVDSEVRDQKDGNYSIYLKTSDDVLPKGYLYTLKNDSVVYADGLTAEEKAKFVKEETVDKRYLIPYYANPKTAGDQPIAWIPASPDPSNPDQLIPDQSALDQMIKNNLGKEMVADTNNIQNNDGSGKPNGEVVQNPNKIINGKEKIDNSYVANYSSSTDSSTIVPIKVVVLYDGSLKFDQTEIDNKLGPELWNLIDIKQNDGNTTALNKDDPKVPGDKKQIDRRLYATELVISQKDNQEKVDREIKLMLNPMRHSSFNGKYVKVRFTTDQDSSATIWTAASQIDANSNELKLNLSKDLLKGNKEYKFSGIFYGDTDQINNSSANMHQQPPLEGKFYVKPTTNPAIRISKFDLAYKTIETTGPKVDLFFSFDDIDEVMYEGRVMTFLYRKVADKQEIAEQGIVELKEGKKVISLPALKVDANEEYVLTKVYLDDKPSRAYFNIGNDRLDNVIYDNTKANSEEYKFTFEFSMDNLANSPDGELETAEEPKTLETYAWVTGRDLSTGPKEQIEKERKVHIKQISQIQELNNKKMKAYFLDNNAQWISSEVLDSSTNTEWEFIVPVTPNRKYVLKYIMFGDSESKLDKKIDIENWDKDKKVWWFETEPSKTYFWVDKVSNTPRQKQYNGDIIYPGDHNPRYEGNWRYPWYSNDLIMRNNDLIKNASGEPVYTNNRFLSTGFEYNFRIENFDEAFDEKVKVKYKVYVDGEDKPREYIANLSKNGFGWYRSSVNGEWIKTNPSLGKPYWMFTAKIGTAQDPSWVVDKTTKVRLGNKEGDIEFIYEDGKEKAAKANKPFISKIVAPSTTTNYDEIYYYLDPKTQS